MRKICDKIDLNRDFQMGAGQGAFGVIKHTPVGRERLKAAGNTVFYASECDRSAAFSFESCEFET